MPVALQLWAARSTLENIANLAQTISIIDNLIGNQRMLLKYTKVCIVFSLINLALLVCPLHAQNGVKYDPQHLANHDILGLKLRMSPELIIDILEREGYEIEQNYLNQYINANNICNFEMAVSNELLRRDNTLPSPCSSPRQIVARSSNGEIRVSLREDNGNPTGLGARIITLQFGNVDTTDIISRLTEKYGPYTSGGEGSFSRNLFFWTSNTGSGPRLNYRIIRTTTQQVKGGILTLSGAGWIEKIVNQAVIDEANRISNPAAPKF